jgi:predicted Rossmann-fold nucleotide-binding protein
MDELFEILTLIKTGKMPQAPVILVGRDFWQPLLNFIENELYEDYRVIPKDFMEIYKIVDSDDEILKIIKNAPLRTDY